jgi:hypothetical protein
VVTDPDGLEADLRQPAMFEEWKNNGKLGRPSSEDGRGRKGNALAGLNKALDQIAELIGVVNAVDSVETSACCQGKARQRSTTWPSS